MNVLKAISTMLFRLALLVYLYVRIPYSGCTNGNMNNMLIIEVVNQIGEYNVQNLGMYMHSCVTLIGRNVDTMYIYIYIHIHVYIKQKTQSRNI